MVFHYRNTGVVFKVLCVQQNRKNLLKTFLEGDSRVLICTDIASRGIDSSKVKGKLETWFSLCLVIK